MTRDHRDRREAASQARPSPARAGREPVGLRLYPAGDLKCVWMVAGMLSYRLCTLQYRCEECPLDKALREVARRGNGTGLAAAP